MAAEAAAKYIEEYGFVPDQKPVPEDVAQKNSYGVNKLGKLAEAAFAYNQVNDKGVMESRVMTLPKLSLIPLPLLHVEQADFDYSVRLLEGDKDGSTQATLTPQSRLSDGSNPHLDANINVKVKVVQSDIPAGLSNLLALMGNNAINSSEKKLVLLDDVLRVKIGSNCRTTVILRDLATNLGVKNTIVTAYYDEAPRFTVNDDKREWKSGTAMMTNEQGAIPVIIGAKYASKDIQPGDVHKVKFVASSGESCILNLFFE